MFAIIKRTQAGDDPIENTLLDTTDTGFEAHDIAARYATQNTLSSSQAIIVRAIVRSTRVDPNEDWYSMPIELYQHATHMDPEGVNDIIGTTLIEMGYILLKSPDGRFHYVKG